MKQYMGLVIIKATKSQ